MVGIIEGTDYDIPVGINDGALDGNSLGTTDGTDMGARGGVINGN